jgi:hypothetical protein
MRAVIEHSLGDFPPESQPYAHERHDDFTYDPVIVKVYRWLQGMEDALSRRQAESEDASQA